MLSMIGNIVIWVSIVFVTLLMLGGIVGGVLEAREERRRVAAAEEEYLRAAQARRESLREHVALWNERIATGTVISLDDDKRTHLLGKKSKAIGDYAATNVFRRDVYDWCRSNLNGKYSIIPITDSDEDATQIWFADPNDAMYFKMRWY